eukprot:TRINITY_DN28213_c0_g1_i1.p1 TRINITY_DN28213_c0_g1~~TRINITY_DN28213_c0_g1_i1.p1  ORF type:complete len:246 (-),score=26.26 TRINITY_DN28213_c0_g1_i1:98-835(-)
MSSFEDFLTGLPSKAAARTGSMQPSTGLGAMPESCDGAQQSLYGNRKIGGIRQNGAQLNNESSQTITAMSFYGSSARPPTKGDEAAGYTSQIQTFAPMSFYTSAQLEVFEAGSDSDHQAQYIEHVGRDHESQSRIGGHACQKFADSDPDVVAVTEALTLQGAQQVLAILRGHKLVENRSWQIPTGWYAIHAGSQMINEERAERIRQVWPDAPAEESLVHSAILGLFFVHSHTTPQAGPKTSRKYS